MPTFTAEAQCDLGPASNSQPGLPPRVVVVREQKGENDVLNYFQSQMVGNGQIVSQNSTKNWGGGWMCVQIQHFTDYNRA